MNPGVILRFKRVYGECPGVLVYRYLGINAITVISRVCKIGPVVLFHLIKNRLESWC